MFKKNHQSGLTFISENCTLNGDMSFSGDVIIHGKIDGNINCTGTITIGKPGCLTGNLKTKKLLVAGKIDGDIKCDFLHVEKLGEVNGLLYCSKIKIDDGGQFFGERKSPTKSAENDKEKVRSDKKMKQETKSK